MPDLATLIRRGNLARKSARPRQIMRRSKRKFTPKDREWIAIDGEGWDTDKEGRQLYRLMAAGTDSGFQEVLYAHGNDDLPDVQRGNAAGDNQLSAAAGSPTAGTLSEVRPPLAGSASAEAAVDARSGVQPTPDGDSRRLSTLEILEWLCWLRWRYRRWCEATGKKYYEPRFCGYGLGYDYAHILLDLGLEDLKAVFHNQDHEAPWAEVGSFRVKLTAGRLQIKRLNHGLQAGYIDLWDTFRYFQSSFIKAVEKTATEEELEVVKAGKERRGLTEHVLIDEAEYTLVECRLLSRLMKQVEEQALALDLHPTSWYGPGSMAHLALKQQGVGECYRTDEDLPEGLADAASRAFVGGRFETTGHGRLSYLQSYDIKSAYPFAITRLPCLAHTEWTLAPGNGVSAPWSLHHVQWANRGEALKGGWGPWPARIQPTINQATAASGGQVEQFNMQMLPTWPWEGQAWVWGPEFRAGVDLLAQSPKADYSVLETWMPLTSCDCQPFAWVEEWYYRRLQMIALDDPRQMWLKLILNSLYGKMAQQVGRAQWHSWLWAGMITAHCRAQLLSAIALDPEAVVMTATDAVYTRRGLGLEISQSLGDWETQALGQCLIVQSGFFDIEEAIYGKRVPRTRGMPARYVEWPKFHARWDEVMAGNLPWDQAHVVIDKDATTGEPFQIHVGIGLAQLWNKPEKLGCWLDYPTEVSFVTDKRPFRWKNPPATVTGEEWVPTRPWSLKSSNEPSDYRAGRGIGEDRFVVMDQPNASEWGEL